MNIRHLTYPVEEISDEVYTLALRRYEDSQGNIRQGEADRQARMSEEETKERLRKTSGSIKLHP